MTEFEKGKEPLDRHRISVEWPDQQEDVAKFNVECPAYRWFRNLIKDREGLFTADEVSTIMAAKGRSDKRFKAWETIRYSPSEVGKILKECLGTDHHDDEGSD